MLLPVPSRRCLARFLLPRAAVNWSTLLAGVLFGCIGFVAFRYGRRQDRLAPVLLGIALMAYPYFVEGAWLTWGLGALGTAALWFFRE